MSVLVEGVAGVVVGGGQGEAVGALFAVAGVVALVGAVGGGAGLVFGFDLAQGVVAPVRDNASSCIASGALGALAEGVDDVVHAADDGVITSLGVGLCQEDVAVRVVVVGNGVRGAGDGG